MTTPTAAQVAAPLQKQPAVIPPRPKQVKPVSQNVDAPQITGSPFVVPEQPVAPQIPFSYMQQPMLPNFGGISLGNHGAAGSLLSALLNQQRAVGMQFHMLSIPAESGPVIQTFDTVDELKAAIQATVGKAVFAHCFMGYHLPITKGPFKFLQTPYGALPLQDIPDPATQETIADGWLGDDMPVTEHIVPQPVSTSVDDEEEDMVLDNVPEYETDDDTIPGDDTDLFAS